MSRNRFCALSVAGFDPSGGAGILADIKTFEANKVKGLGVVSAITFQNELEFTGVEWVSQDSIIKQINIVTKVNNIEFVKIGMIQNADVLDKILDTLTEINPKIKIIWDPILSTSTQYKIHETFEIDKLQKICRKIFLITPNMNEIRILMNESDTMKAADLLGEYCNVYLKGGHSEKNLGRDYLIFNRKTSVFKAPKISPAGKHGTGCVLSAGITASLAKGFTIHKACLRAKDYVTNYLFCN